MMLYCCLYGLLHCRMKYSRLVSMHFIALIKSAENADVDKLFSQYTGC